MQLVFTVVLYYVQAIGQNIFLSEFWCLHQNYKLLPGQPKIKHVQPDGWEIVDNYWLLMIMIGMIIDQQLFE